MNPFKIVMGAARSVLGGGKGGPLAVGVVDQIGKTGEWGVLLTGAGVFVFACGLVYVLYMAANYFFAGG